MMVTLMMETSPRMARPPQQRRSGQVTTFLLCPLTIVTTLDKSVAR